MHQSPAEIGPPRLNEVIELDPPMIASVTKQTRQLYPRMSALRFPALR